MIKIEYAWTDFDNNLISKDRVGTGTDIEPDVESYIEIICELTFDHDGLANHFFYYRVLDE